MRLYEYDLYKHNICFSVTLSRTFQILLISGILKSTSNVPLAQTVSELNLFAPQSLSLEDLRYIAAIGNDVSLSKVIVPVSNLGSWWFVIIAVIVVILSATCKHTKQNDGAENQKYFFIHIFPPVHYSEMNSFLWIKYRKSCLVCQGNPVNQQPRISKMYKHSRLTLVAQRTVINKKMAELGVNMW